jgi:hypothetical protein
LDFCEGVTFAPPSAFYDIAWDGYSHYVINITEVGPEEMDKKLEIHFTQNTISHLWGSFKTIWPFLSDDIVPEEILYGRLMKHACPVVFANQT